MRALQIVGRKKSGKTSLVTRLIPLLRARGLRVGTVKHSSHPHALDRRGADSQQHREAGSEATLVITAAAAALHFAVPADAEALVERFLGEMDLVLIEGWSHRRGPRIEVLPAGPDGEVKPPLHAEPGELVAAVLSPGVRASEDALRAIGFVPADTVAAVGAAQVPCFSWQAIDAVVDRIVAWL